jgi:hypothetical protein
MKWASIHPRSPGFFPFGEGGKGAGFFEIFFCSYCVPTESVQCVPQRVSNIPATNVILLELT